MRIRETSTADLNAIMHVESLAFGHDKESRLARDLLNDTSAKPTLSLLAYDGHRAVGHILFTSARLAKSRLSTSIRLLAPLAVIPDTQRQGIGGRLIERGLQLLAKSKVDLVFVLGHPGYYPRHGFQPAGRLGFEAPFPIPDECADAWMVQALRPEIIGVASGRIVCADALNKPEYWREPHIFASFNPRPREAGGVPFQAVGYFHLVSIHARVKRAA